MISDDHVLIREGIKQLLEFDGDIEIIAEANDGLECLSVLRRVLPDVLFLDINMPHKNGIEVLQEIRNENIPVKVLILTVHNEIDYLVRAVEIGVDGYLLKNSGSAELKKAIHSVINGESYIQPDLIPELNARLVTRNDNREKIDALTRRELEVLILVASGMFNKEIAEEMKISERTVKNHISSIFKKIDVADRTQAAVFAIKNNLVEI
ncbi:response regulator [Staphylococcus nepalensis]|uniref:response regulator n=1 Tax=Staphylococcus nepalensis TaxID=214473 RepID=UPI0024B87F35|nr:response regulator transcription factor [Staphylococcus nepalensis]